MALVVFFKDGATPQRVTGIHKSYNEGPLLASARTDYLLNPDLTGLESVSQKYLKVVGSTPDGTVAEYTQAEKDTQDAAEAAATDTNTRAGAKDMYDGFNGWALALKALAETMRREINILRAEHSLAERTLAQLRTAIDSRIDDGTVDS